MESFLVDIPLSVHRRAKAIAEQQRETAQAEIVYRNNLAVYATHVYMRCMGIPVDLGSSDSQDILFQTLSNTGALMLSGVGKLECRPVAHNAENMYVPEGVWGDRIGYLAVQLNADLTEGKILGFVKAVHQTQVPITVLKSLDEFLDYFEQLEPVLLNLKNWVSRMAQSGWMLVSDSINGMLSERPAKMQWAVRSQSIATRKKGVTCQKNLGQVPFRISLYLCEDEGCDYDIIVELDLESLSNNSSINTVVNLSSNKSQDSGNILSAAILDESGIPLKAPEIFHIGHGATDTAGIFEISGDKGDRFIIKVVYQGDLIEEPIDL
jgi:hypothetical protein